MNPQDVLSPEDLEMIEKEVISFCDHVDAVHKAILHLANGLPSHEDSELLIRENPEDTSPHKFLTYTDSIHSDAVLQERTGIISTEELNSWKDMLNGLIEDVGPAGITYKFLMDSLDIMLNQGNLTPARMDILKNLEN